MHNFIWMNTEQDQNETSATTNLNLRHKFEPLKQKCVDRWLNWGGTVGLTDAENPRGTRSAQKQVLALQAAHGLVQI